MGRGSILSGLLSPLRFKDKNKENILYTVFEEDDANLALDSTYEVYDWNEGQFKSKNLRTEYKGLRIFVLWIIKSALFVLFSQLTFYACLPKSSGAGYRTVFKICTAITGASALLDFTKLLVISFINLQVYRKKSANYKVGSIKRRIIDHYIYVKREMKMFLFIFGIFIILWKYIDINTLIDDFIKLVTKGSFKTSSGNSSCTLGDVVSGNIASTTFLKNIRSRTSNNTIESGIIEFVKTLYERDHLSNIVMLFTIYAAAFLIKKIFINNTAATFHQTSIGARIKSNRVCRKITEHLCRKHLTYDENQIIGEALERKDLALDSKIMSLILKTISDGLFKLLAEEELEEVEGKAGEKVGEFRIKEKYLMKYLSYKEADNYFNSMDIDSIGTVSKAQFDRFILSLWVEKDSLIKSTKSQNEVIKKYDSLLLMVTHCAALSCCMSWLEKDVKHKGFTASLGGIIFFILYISDDILLRAFNSILFIIYTHPFDVGDSIKVYNSDTKTWDRMMVKEVGLWACKFSGGQNQYIMMPNYLLRDKMIINIRRSPNQYESLTITIQADTPLPKIRELEARLLKWVSDHYEEFQPELYIEGFELKNKTEMEISINVAHRGNFHDYAVQAARTQKFYFYLRDLMDELGIELGSIE